MPTKNFYIVLIVAFLSIFIASKTSLKNQIVLQVAHQLKEHCLEPPTSDRLFQGALSGMAAAVGDDHYTEYIPPHDKTDYMRELQGQYAGVGLGNFIKDSKSGEFYFVPLRNSPSQKAGLKIGDRITEVEGQSVVNMSIIDLTSLLRGEAKTSVHIKVRSRASILKPQVLPHSDHNNEPLPFNQSSSNDALTNDVREVTIERDVVQQDVVSGDRIDLNGNWIYTLKDNPDIGYIRVNEFVDSTGRQVAEALTKLEIQGVSKVIIDFRNNPGGFIRDAVDICNEFLSTGSPIVETRNQKGTIERYIANRYPRRRFTVAVIIDGGSASASEIVSAALQDAEVAKVIGVRSYGKGTIQGIFELPCNSGILRMTTASFWRPSGSPIHRKQGALPEDDWGVSPNPGFEVPVSMVQNFYSSWIRRVRVLEPEAGAMNEKILEFMTSQTNDILRHLLEGQGMERFEAATELGLDLSQINLEKDTHIPPNNDEVSNESEESSDETSDHFIAFKPLGRAPYYDPQLDKAIDYLHSETSMSQEEIQVDKSLDVKKRYETVL